ncbi:MAG TPA: nucleotide pyrophosphatase/phosphodiesterase family protein [Dermatophilaceae bacterium]|nr:nucleotide pyrophosphatase/phosphodiesterase family protein [Dermatophilaceae bacterium]
MASAAASATSPAYGAGGLAGVLPSVLRSLGVAEGPQAGSDLATVHPLPSAGGAGLLELPPARRAVVALIDGLGYDLLRQRGGHAPFLRGLLPAAYRLSAGFPSTTATSMGTFGTGLPPGAHGLVGYEVLVPGEDQLLNELSWTTNGKHHGPDPRRWQPRETVFERAEAAGVAVTRIGPGFFDGSGLTRAALRGGTFRAAHDLTARVLASVDALRAASRSLVYLYWGDLDKVGHVFGCRSWEWGDELEVIDAALAQLVDKVPADTAVYVTGDHGMVDAPHALRIDLAYDPVLSAGVRHVGGEPRALQLYCEPGAAADVLATWRERVGRRAWVHSREEVVRAGWFGQVTERVLPRIGDVVVAMRENFAIVDSRRARPELLALIGLHGSLTSDEEGVPLVVVPPRGRSRTV